MTGCATAIAIRDAIRAARDGGQLSSGRLEESLANQCGEAVSKSKTAKVVDSAEWPADCRLAYGLERQFGRVCSRIGGAAICGAAICGAAICGACASWVQKSDTEAAGCGEMGNPMSGSLNGHEVTQRPPLVNSGPS